jgi:hypothetical protein
MYWYMYILNIAVVLDMRPCSLVGTSPNDSEEPALPILGVDEQAAREENG